MLQPNLSLATRLQALWYGPSAPPWGLRMLAGLFGAAVSARRVAYARGLLVRQRIGAPVIVVGNLTVGGSGKTPLVVWCCEQLRELGWRPGVVLRGYGGRAAQAAAPTLVSPQSDPTLVGDEAVLLARRTHAPVVVCRDRVHAARRLLQEGVNVVVSDDGLQHLALARDLELAVVDATRGLGNGWLLPAGPLRERAPRLASVDAIVLNGAGEGLPPAAGETTVPMFRMELRGERLWPLQGNASPRELSQWRGARVHAVAGIGHPGRFFALLRAAGLQLIEHAFPDHHRYCAAELEFGDGLPLLMTEKDAVKCQALGVGNAWWLPVAASFPAPQGAALRELLGGVLPARAPAAAAVSVS